MQRWLDYAEKPEHATMRSTLKIGLCAFGLAISTFTHAEELGRLFFTPEQRAQMDYNFVREAQPDNSTVMLNGIVQRHGGKRTAWINGVPQQAGSSDEKTPESMSVQLPGQNKSVKLKVGQRVLLNLSTNPDTAKPDTPKSDTSNQDASKP
jgi:hypothetical protein